MASVLDTLLSYLSIGMHASILVRIVGNPSVISFHVLSLLLGLGRILVIFYVMLSLLSLGLIFCRIVSLRDPSRRMCDDGAGMHEYLLCTILVCGSGY
jgi:hypothetical protein